jgi:hypothetical protein
MPDKSHTTAIYQGRGNPAMAAYYPSSLDNLADDATLEGSLLDGSVQGAEAVQSIVIAIDDLPRVRIADGRLVTTAASSGPRPRVKHRNNPDQALKRRLVIFLFVRSCRRRICPTARNDL